MRPRHIAYIIWTVIALLGVVCMVVPDGGWYIGKWNLRFPTLAEALDMKEDSMADVDLEILSDSLLAEADTVSVLPTDSLIQQDTLATQDSVPQKPQYPRVDLKRKQEEFLKELELIWEERNLALARKAGLIAPKFQGGDIDDFALWVNSQVVYPIRDRADRNSRTVIVEFVVLRDGTVSDAHAVFGSDPVLNEAAVAAVMKSPKWTPGEQNGQTRNVRMSVPVVFDL